MRLRTLCFFFCLAGLVAANVPAAVSGEPAQSAQPAQARTVPEAAEITSMTALPAEIRAALGEMSDRGGPFAPGCISLHGEPHLRFASARVGADTARVTVEQGGIAHFFDQREFRKVDGHWVALPPVYR